jgi:hypothetical protein
MSAVQVLWVLSAICFFIGALLGLAGDQGLLGKINWTNAGLFFAAVAIAYNA